MEARARHRADNTSQGQMVDDEAHTFSEPVYNFCLLAEESVLKNEGVGPIKLFRFIELSKAITDEAVDVPIYMISAALGFAALENSLFLLAPLFDNDIQAFILTTKLRFIGATLVHVASSALIGIFSGYSLFFAKKIHKMYIVGGFVLSVVLHAMFNLFIIKNSQNSFAGFLLIWIFVVLIIVLFERIKRIKVNTIDNVREEKKEDTD